MMLVPAAVASRVPRALVLGALLFAITACGVDRGQPTSVSLSFVAALQDGDAVAVWDLAADELRAGSSPDQLLEDLRGDHFVLGRLSSLAASADIGSRADVHVSGVLPNGDELSFRLVLDRGVDGWAVSEFARLDDAV